MKASKLSTAALVSVFFLTALTYGAAWIVALTGGFQSQRIKRSSETILVEGWPALIGALPFLVVSAIGVLALLDQFGVKRSIGMPVSAFVFMIPLLVYRFLW